MSKDPVAFRFFFYNPFMPEIAEVEIQRRGLEQFRGQTLQSLQIDRLFSAHPAKRLAGQTLHAVLRHGKLLGLEFEHDLLAVHLRMTGGFLLEKTPHNRASFLFDEPLYFSDPRRFATMDFMSSWSAVNLGPDLWNLHPGWVPGERYQFSRRPIKSTILDQKVLAGIGNYLADESLWAAAIHPSTPTHEVSSESWRRIVARAQELSRAVLDKGGVSLRDYQNISGQDGQGGELLLVYGRRGKPCKRCKQPLEKMRISGRGTTWCPSCQG